MKFGFIGAGKVGFSLGKYFSINSITLSGYYSKNFLSALEASKFTSSKAYETIEELIKESDIIFITTPDDCIKHIWNEISSYNIKEKIICHTSGSLSSDIFTNLTSTGAYGYSIHPMFPFSDKYNTYKNLNNAYFSIDGDEKYQYTIKSIFQKLGNNVILIEKEKKPLYHLANVTVSNLVLALINIGCNYLIECGVDNKDALMSLLPLISNNVNNLKKVGVINSLTGPIERGDIGTIEKHLKAIPKKDIELYITLSMELIRISKEKNKGKDYDTLINYLGGIKNEEYSNIF